MHPLIPFAVSGFSRVKLEKEELEKMGLITYLIAIIIWLQVQPKIGSFTRMQAMGFLKSLCLNLDAGSVLSG